ncbi:MAG TPA: biotin transporter BioY [Alphaproteobacteria bacterium]|nr:biotin transporter BioY [Paracoccaceae bacterium]RCL81402.1 MAG: biotin transporter BioY [SAR116 cluster bacterium]RPH14010.1 MAG: biotin transporter BioY [Alphaproteobacteria bacterium TMED150]HBQ23535.1 biotin transporter BioY [Alphaproteobacteria bacterium]HCY48533.1 biotin transporter BioY [Alphaproteobacteria bacterium]|tara:strand:+ start:2965 stop:3558 length:594 start_codon:yes stop_codon:yes gene_type:complete
MAQHIQPRGSILEHLWPADEFVQKALRIAFAALVGSVLLTLSAKIQVPFLPVPMTLQVLAILMMAASFGRAAAVAAVMLYLVQGAAGVPVFAGTPEKGVGLAYMMGPTGGYLLGFLFMAWMVGGFVDKAKALTRHKMIGVMLLATLVMYVPGVLWLGVLFGFDQPLLAWGVFPFILGDLLKALIAGLTFPMLRRWVG